jgi:hypothetical protein
MTKKRDDFKSDIIEFRNRIKRFREKIIEEILEKDEDTNDENMLKLAKKEYDELDKFLDIFHNKLIIDIYKIKESIQFEIEDLAIDVSKMRSEIKVKRKELKGENVVETSKNILTFLEKKFKKMGQKIRNVMDWDSDFDLIENLK